MRRLLFVLAVICALCAPLTVLAEDQPAPPGATPAPAAEPPPPPVTPPITPGVAARPSQTANCVVPTLRVISARMVQTLAIKLQLSEVDKAKVLNLLTKSEEDSAALFEAQRKAAEDYAIALTKDTTTQAELLAAAEKATKAEGEVLNLKIKTLFALRAKLTPEQNTALTALLKQNAMMWLPREMRMMPPLPVPDGPPLTTPTAPTGPPTPAGG